MTARQPAPAASSTLAQLTSELTISPPTTTAVQQLISDLQRLLEDVDSADVVFLCGREEERVHAHRVLLMARCKNFKLPKRGELCRIPGATISSATTPSTPTQVRLPHVRVEILRQFISYVYTAKIVLQDSRVFEVLSLAQDMGVEELKATCEEYVISALSLEKSSTKHTTAFVERCVIYIGENANECVKRNAFLSLNKDALIKLISSDYFCLEEEDVWRCVLAWAKKQAGVTQNTAQWTEDEQARVCQHLSGVIGHVRLLLIDSQVFAEEVEPTGAVPIELSLERYRYAALHSNNAPIVPTRGAELNEDKRLQPRLTVNMFPGSQILKNEKLHWQGVLNRWYGAPKQIWRLVFRASSHGYSSSAFHRLCDGVSPCFVIGISSRGEVSGGFTDVPWGRTNSKGGYIHSDHAFLFALNPTGSDVPIKFDIVKKPYAICYHQDFGPIFGAGADLLFSSNCHSNVDSYSNMPHSYDGPNASCSALFGDYNFTILDYELYTPANSPAQSDVDFSESTMGLTQGQNNTNVNNEAASMQNSSYSDRGPSIAANKTKYERY